MCAPETPSGESRGAPWAVIGAGSCGRFSAETAFVARPLCRVKSCACPLADPVGGIPPMLLKPSSRDGMFRLATRCCGSGL